MALENGVSQYPNCDGRFPQVSGIGFTFDDKLPPGKRILCNDIYVNGEVLEYEKVKHQ